MKNFKFALSGFVMGILVSFGFSFADEGTYTLTKMDAKIFVEGSERKIDEPILNLNGRAYLPLRKFGEISRGEISWEPTTKVISYRPFTQYSTSLMPKEVIKEVVKEVPKEVIKEVEKKNPDDLKIVKTNEKEYFATNVDKDGNGEGYMFSPKGLTYAIFKNKSIVDGKNYTMESKELIEIFKKLKSDNSNYSSDYNSNISSLFSLPNINNNYQPDNKALYISAKNELDRDHQNKINQINRNYDYIIKSTKEVMNERGILSSSTLTDSENQTNKDRQAEIDRENEIYNTNLNELKIIYGINE